MSKVELSPRKFREFYMIWKKWNIQKLTGTEAMLQIGRLFNIEFRSERKQVKLLEKSVEIPKK